jgi:L-ascorbate metabolism protein UlaG (beta-lactamase superfamily)
MTRSNSTTSLESQISSLTVSPNTAACVWLGQGGYLFKSPQGVTVMVDAYLSDYAEPMWGVTRAIPPVVDPERFAPDVFLTTHWHEDHLDAPTVRRYSRQPDVVFGGPESCVVRAQIWGWPVERTVRLDRGGSHRFGDVTVTATFARHDEEVAMTRDAVGFLLDIGRVRFWDVADSEYDARLRPMREEGIDVMLVPINGVGGNMNAHEAALLVWHVAPRIAVPMHYGMWPEEQYGPGATLDPAIFRDTLARLGSGTVVQVLEPGEITLFHAS